MAYVVVTTTILVLPLGLIHLSAVHPSPCPPFSHSFLYPTARLPFSIRVLLESAVRNCDEFSVTRKDVENIIDWEEKRGKNVEIPFKPARVILQDLT